MKTILKFMQAEHVEYLQKYTSSALQVEELIISEIQKMNGLFFLIGSFKILNLPIDKREEFIHFILNCQNEDGGFGNNIGFNSHIVSTHYAILCLLLLDFSFDHFNQFSSSKHKKKDRNIRDYVCSYIMTLSNSDGSFKGDQSGEVDTRFVYCAVSCLSILNKVELINKDKIATYVMSTYDLHNQGFAWVYGNEPHAASVFCCLGTLFLINKIYLINEYKLAEWLSHRQSNNGGFNGRTEKLTDTCYSWWIFSSLIILKKYHWINNDALEKYILLCQDIEHGGISDNPDCLPDMCHTFFGLAALSLLNILKKKDSQTEEELYPLQEMHPIYALPIKVVKQKQLPLYDIDLFSPH